MDGHSTTSGPVDDRLGWRRPELKELLTKLVAGLLMGVAVELLLMVFHESPPLRWLETVGKDYVFNRVARQGVSSGTPLGKYVFVDVDDSSLERWNKHNGQDARPEILDVVSRLRNSRAKIVVLDIFFDYRPGEPNPLFAVAGSPGKPVVAVADIHSPDPGSMGLASLAANYQPLAQHPPKELTLATGEVVRENGEVRYRVASTCVDDGDSMIVLPGVAEAVRDVLSGAKADGKEAGPAECRDDRELKELLFLLPWQPLKMTPLQDSVKEISAADVQSGSADLDDAIVVVGQTHAATNDNFQTPFNRMPGAFVHLNSIAGLQILGPTRAPSWWVKTGLFVLIVSFVTVMNQFYWFFHLAFVRDCATQHRWSGFLAFILDAAVFVAVNILAVYFVIDLTTSLGKSLLSQGVIIGTLVPAFAVILEAAFELGRPIMFWLEQLAEFLLDLRTRLGRLARAPKTHAAWLLFLLAAGSTASAEEQFARLRPEGDARAADIIIERHTQNGVQRISGQQTLSVVVGDVVRVVRNGAVVDVISLTSRTIIARVTYGHPIRCAYRDAQPDDNGLDVETGGSRAQLMPDYPSYGSGNGAAMTGSMARQRP